MKKLILFTLLILPLGLFAQVDYYEVISEAEAKTLQKEDSLELQQMLKKAESGGAEAQFKLGYMYRTGQRPDERSLQVTSEIGFLDYYSNSFYQNYEEAITWLDRSAKQGYAEAENEVGLMYDYGLGIEANGDSAFYYYDKAAQKCLPVAQNNIARLYYLGKGTEIDYQTSYAWAIIALENGNTMAARGVGLLEEELSEVEIEQAKKLKEEIKQTLQCK